MDLSRKFKIRKVCFTVHLFSFFILQFFVLQAQDFPKYLYPYYETALHYQSNQWPLLSTDTIGFSDQPHAIYINALAGSLRQILAGEAFPDEHWKNWQKRLQESPEDTYAAHYLAELSLFRSIIYLFNRQELRAFIHFRQAYKQSNQNLNTHPLFLPNLKTAGIINLQIGVLPEKYNWILALLGFSGDIEKGKQQIEQLGMSNHLFNSQAQLIDLLFNTYILGKTSFEAVQKMQVAYPESQLMRLVFNAVAIKSNLSREVINNTKPSSIPIVYGQIAESFLNKLALDSALHFFDLYLATSQKNISAEMAYKIAITHHLIGNDAKAAEFKNIGLNKATVVSEADEYARYQLSQEQMPCRDIIALRLLTDGGFFDEAKKIAESNGELPQECSEERQEFLYRIARLWQLTGKTDLAISTYHQMFTIESEGLSYIQPNAHLQLGVLYLAKGDTVKARSHLSDVLSFKGYPYESSIRTKTKLLQKSLE